MKPDPVIERIKQIRREISEQCGHDTRRLIEYYIKYQQKHTDRLIKKSAAEKVRYQ